MNKLDDLIERAGLTEIATMGGGGWDWAQMSVWYSEEERQFFWLGEEGCSCSYFGMDVRGLDSLENGSKEDALNALRRYTDAENRYSPRISTDHYLRAKEAIKNVQVSA